MCTLQAVAGAAAALPRRKPGCSGRVLRLLRPTNTRGSNLGGKVLSAVSGQSQEEVGRCDSG